MKKTQRNKRKFTIIAAIAAVIAAAVILFVYTYRPKPNVQVENNNQSAQSDRSASQKPSDPAKSQAEATSNVSQAKDVTNDPKADPSTLGSVDVTPLSLKVFYTHGIPGFEFSVNKTADQTEYVEFTSPQLVGTKCTDDNGLFASIIKNPESAEDKATVTQLVKLGSDSYGLSLAGDSCTSNTELLQQYQTAFMNGFNSLAQL